MLAPHAQLGADLLYACCESSILTDTPSPRLLPLHVRLPLRRYFRKSSNERFTAIVARGVYRVNFFTIGNSCNNQHSMLLINGANKYETHGHTSGWNWIDSQVDATFRAAAGVWWGIRTHAACGRTSSYPFSHHSRIEVHFLGSYDA